MVTALNGLAHLDSQALYAHAHASSDAGFCLCLSLSVCLLETLPIGLEYSQSEQITKIFFFLILILSQVMGAWQALHRLDFGGS